MSIQSKFDLIVENALHRHQRTEFLVGDLVELVDNWGSDDWVKRQSGGQVDRVREIAEAGHHLRVAGIRGLYGDGNNGLGNQESPDYQYVELVEELSPGRYTNFFTVPVHLVRRIELEGNNITAPVPDDQRRDSTSHIEPLADDIVDGGDPMGSVKQTRVDHPDKILPDENVVLPGATAAKSYTANYMP
jgi:hypothetical protein